MGRHRDIEELRIKKGENHSTKHKTGEKIRSIYIRAARLGARPGYCLSRRCPRCWRACLSGRLPTPPSYPHPSTSQLSGRGAVVNNITGAHK